MTESVTVQTGKREFAGDAALTNDDLLPTLVLERRWTWWHFAALWMGMVHNIFNFTWMGGLILLGFSIWQAFLIAAIGTVIQTLVIGLSGRVGARFGIPFPVWARSAFGVRGANIPAVLRGLTAIGWFGVQSYLAALAVNVLLSQVIPAWSNLGQYSFLGATANLWAAMVIYWMTNFLILRHGMETIRRFESWAGPAVFIVVAVMLVWMLTKANGVGPLFTQPAQIGMSDFFATKLIPGVALFIAGSWATMTLNIPDLTRFARSNREQFWGTMIGLPLASLVYYVMAATIVSTGITVFHKTLWDPAAFLTAIDVPALSIIGALVLALATISVNVPANIVSPAYDLCNLFPSWFTFKRGAVVSIILSFVYGPWIIMKDPSFFYSILDNIGVVLGPILGIMICDYLIVRRGRLDVQELYRLHGGYRASSGFNLVGLGVFVVASAILVTSEFVASIGWLYNSAWFAGVILGFVGYGGSAALLRAAGASYAAHLRPMGDVGSEAATVQRTSN